MVRVIMSYFGPVLFTGREPRNNIVVNPRGRIILDLIRANTE